jgi:hypothetical protein
LNHNKTTPELLPTNGCNHPSKIAARSKIAPPKPLPEQTNHYQNHRLSHEPPLKPSREKREPPTPKSNNYHLNNHHLKNSEQQTLVTPLKPKPSPEQTNHHRIQTDYYK